MLFHENFTKLPLQNFRNAQFRLQEINWIFKNKRRTRITKNLINAAAFNRINTVTSARKSIHISLLLH